MEQSTHELYENARKRIKQKRNLYYHFVIFVLGSLFLYVAQSVFHLLSDYNWFPWVLTVWVFLLMWHFIKVHITDRFMNKAWEREQIDKLITKQEKKIKELQDNLNQDSLKKQPPIS